MRRRIVLGLVIVAALLFTGVALALTSGELEPRANEWQAKACTPATLASKKAKAGQEIALCYALREVQEHKANIESLSLDSADLRTRLLELEAHVASLEARGPANFSFFTAAQVLGGNEVVSSVFDAAKDDKAFIQAEGTNNATWKLEVSDDQLTWLVAAEGATRSETKSVTLSGRYLRVTVAGLPGTAGEKSFTILAHFS